MSINRTQPKTPGLALSVLSLLIESPMHPYEMKMRIKERGHEQVIQVKGGSLYDTVERLQRQGLIQPKETEIEGEGFWPTHEQLVKLSEFESTRRESIDKEGGSKNHDTR